MDLFWQKVQITPNKCWLWTAGTVRGYGFFQKNYAHRISYEISKGKIPDGLTLDHLCRNKLCVNPDHLEPVTASENVKRYHRSKTHCKYGHPFTEDNMYIITFNNSRRCRKCVLRYAHESYKKRKNQQHIAYAMQ